MPDKSKEEGAAGRVAGVIVSHGQVANELLSAAETIIGNFKHITAVSIGWHDDVEAAKNEIRRAIERVSVGGGVLVMTDMFGGTPTNIASMFLQQGEVEVVTDSFDRSWWRTYAATLAERFGQESIHVRAVPVDMLDEGIP